jgi:transcriptional regulator with XRE-family HTH domain
MISVAMNVPSLLRGARLRAGLSQRQLAERAGTSQATLSAYERGTKTPNVQTFDRLLRAAGMELLAIPVREPMTAGMPDTAELGRRFVDALSLAEALPYKPKRHLTYPRIPMR